MTIATSHKFTAKAMGTAASLHIDDSCDAVVAEKAWRNVISFLWKIEQTFSTFKIESEISKINSGNLNLLDASPSVIEVFDACTWLEHASDGAFRARRPDGSLDPAGFVKGWATQCASRLLTENNLKNWYLCVGGDIQTSGRQASGELWSVGVIDPQDQKLIRCTVDIPENWAIATSGNSARGQHIWGADENSVGETLRSFSVIGPDLMWADAFATAGFAKGKTGAEWVNKFSNYLALEIK
ncbi:MAG: FAD:protein FMN transferase [Actinobacteria bacterium]|nr:MAG: FAD:protein FMN transferase [Actinomycetota bacterium]